LLCFVPEACTLPDLIEPKRGVCANTTPNTIYVLAVFRVFRGRPRDFGGGAASRHSSSTATVPVVWTASGEE
jgi:hypothetical protein